MGKSQKEVTHPFFSISPNFLPCSPHLPSSPRFSQVFACFRQKFLCVLNLVHHRAKGFPNFHSNPCKLVLGGGFACSAGFTKPYNLGSPQAAKLEQILAVSISSEKPLRNWGLFLMLSLCYDNGKCTQTLQISCCTAWALSEASFCAVKDTSQ